MTPRRAYSIHSPAATARSSRTMRRIARPGEAGALSAVWSSAPSAASRTSVSTCDATWRAGHPCWAMNGSYVDATADAVTNRTATRCPLSAAEPSGAVQPGRDGARQSRSVVENDREQRVVNRDIAVVLDESQVPELVHEEVHARPRGPDHLRKRFLRQPRNL